MPSETATTETRPCRNTQPHDPHDRVVGEYLPVGDLGHLAHCPGVPATAALTTEITVLCSYCKEPTTVPFHYGAVMPMPESNEGVRVHIGAVRGGDHHCRSDRRKDERAWWLRSHPEAESA